MKKIKMTKDIRNYQPKIFGPFTFRQLICAAIALICGMPGMKIVFHELIHDGDMGLGVMLTVFSVAPAVLCGWANGNGTIDGTPVEMYFLRVIYRLFLTPIRRKNICHNEYYEEYRKYKKSIEADRVSKMDKESLKNYKRFRKSGKVKTSQDKSLIEYR